MQKRDTCPKGVQPRKYTAAHAGMAFPVDGPQEQERQTYTAHMYFARRRWCKWRPRESWRPWRRKGGRQKQHGGGGRCTNEVGGGSTAVADGDGSSAKTTECSRRNGRGHIADVRPASKEDDVLAVTGEVGARADAVEEGTAQASAF